MTKVIETRFQKFALFSDIHFGKTKDSIIKLRTSVDFIKWFLERCEENKVDAVIFGGDWFDNRSNISVATLNIAYDYLKKIAIKYPVFMIVGNHDSTLKNTIKVNSLNQFNEIPNVTIIDEPTIVQSSAGREILLCPWDTNISVIDKMYDCVIGHFEFAGAETAGLNIQESSNVTINDLTKNVPLVFSGHFHIRKEYAYGDRKLITIGSPFELDWGDYGNKKGIYFYDSPTRTYTFIENIISPCHVKIHWSLIQKDPNIICEGIVKNNYVRLIVDEKFKYSDLLKTQDKINQLNPIRCCDTEFMFSGSNEDLDSIDINSDIEIKMTNLDYIKKFISKMEDRYFDVDVSKEKLSEMATQYYRIIEERAE